MINPSDNISMKDAERAVTEVTTAYLKAIDSVVKDENLRNQIKLAASDHLLNTMMELINEQLGNTGSVTGDYDLPKFFGF
jgi:hypothetical protein